MGGFVAHRTARQTEIIEESLVIIAEYGMEGLTYRNLSQRLGISIPAFYRHFACKTDILLGIIDYFRECSLGIFQSAESRGVDVVDRLGLFLIGHARLFSQKSGLVTVLFPEEIGVRTRGVRESVLAAITENCERLTALMADGAAAGLLRSDISPKRLAFFLIGSLRLSVTLWRLDEREPDLVQEVGAMWRGLERLIREPGLEEGRSNRGEAGGDLQRSRRC
jgi:AcrR family transcriptional regulator